MMPMETELLAPFVEPAAKDGKILMVLCSQMNQIIESCIAKQQEYSDADAHYWFYQGCVEAYEHLLKTIKEDE